MDYSTLREYFWTGVGMAVTAVAAGLSVWFWRLIDARKNLRVRVTDLEAQMMVVKAQAVGVNAVFQSLLVKSLTHYHTPETDVLLAKLGDEENPPTITDEELDELVILMRQRTKDLSSVISEEERGDAVMLPFVIKRVKKEAEELALGKNFIGTKIIGMLPEGELEENGSQVN